MAQQFNLLGSGQIIPTGLSQEMEQSYLEYAMSVIVGRALPDVRDGLKPVHRRILYAMHELGLTPERPFRKCARVVGDVLGKYHPHGDQAVYEALVRMIQDFSSRYPLLAGHGNFGSVDNDPPAAMRYTETRLAPIAHEALLGEISEATVDFIGNFDNSQQEPLVLPAQLPTLLLNGCAGIAVGMATNVPPHNLGEVVDGLIALIDKPELPDEKLWQLIPGPDFPTGGEIVGEAGIKEAYRTGRGTFPVRGVVKFEQLRLEKARRRERTAIVVTELPYQVNKAGWIEKVAELVNQGRLEGIGNIRDESDRTGMRVVIELKREVNPEAVLAELYDRTPLQTNLGTIILALVNNQPSQLSLRQLLDEFLKFREQTLTRQYSHELEVAQRRLHVAEGLLVALNRLDAVIEILRNAPDGSTAKLTLQEELGITESQADSILAMPLRRLTGLERQKLQTEVEELQAQIAKLEQLLSNRHELMKALKKELRSLKRKYSNERRTRIVSSEAGSAKAEGQRSRGAEEPGSRGEIPKSQAPTEDAVLEVTEQGYIRWKSPEAASKSSRSQNKGNDLVVYRQPIGKRQQLIAVTASGKAYPVNVQNLPGAQQKKTSLVSLLPRVSNSESKTVVTQFFLPEASPSLDVVLLSEKGKLKRLPLSELKHLTSRGLTLIKLKEKDYLSHICFAQEGDEVAIATTGARLLRLEVNDEQLPIMGRAAQGNQATRLRHGEGLVGCVSLKADENLLLVSRQGYAKRLPMSALRLANRGDIGTQAFQFTSNQDGLVGMLSTQTSVAQVSFLTNTKRLLRVSLNSVSFWGKDGVGDRIAKLKPEEEILRVTPLETKESPK
ncbi:MAG: DNA topoisomerase IV [Cyanobacteria bacterium QH_8_48_120]|jgi:DNA gyrase subunit A|nr:MAG: DNA topoisomerase IV [Cyanobacteria bacterium QH_1_48_107]PSO53818.1 MAG: DNA topoisomerase IV [Cyanobacteria bacterium QH_10_48_56]PSO61130.1 MAG: DNA topoisomerase IV [Cyanobacteria bacterium QH_7_48_89]PSO68894.1 MAG: DNA topoisomerase IV [Cyanobacteria bacterium QH_6_48_35]PSO74987.1 MAG: DNA topoisomerase IV [Cyanobacteria bacterium QH_8_48_120]PSP03882.1 MAG: DNA topoisomerase IV [Cyanobacteria bacterium QS_7_48_42]PSP30476.1 MAG: DNA topoisomerase IV [Cyanobacteria bacterium SW